MIPITLHMRVLVAVEPVDLRKYAPSMIMRSRSKSRTLKLKLCFVRNRSYLAFNSA